MIFYNKIAFASPGQRGPHDGSSSFLSSLFLQQIQLGAKRVLALPLLTLLLAYTYNLVIRLNVQLKEEK
jgi:hypothetical protein